MLRFKLILLIFLFYAVRSYAAMELNFDFSYDRKIYGDERQNKMVTRSYGGSWAWYLFQYTGLELNYTYQRDTTIENETYPITGTTYEVRSIENNIYTDVYGIGVRQVLATKGSRIVPMLSLGYAKQFVEDETTVTFVNTADGSQLISQSSDPKRRIDSAFMSFALRIALTQTFALKGSIKTLFPAFEFDKMKDDLKYNAGFSWFF